MDVINRTFVGIRIPQAVTEALERDLWLVKRKPGVENIRWNRASELLITIASLGELGPGTIHMLRQVLPPVVRQYPSMELQIRGFAGLPNMIQPRYMYAGVEGDNGELAQLAGAVDSAVILHVPHRDIKPFHPFIILGRLKTENEQYRVALGRALRLVEQPNIATMQVDAIDLLISNASETGIGYTVVERLPLAASPQ